jgi:hypothetical protein
MKTNTASKPASLAHSLHYAGFVVAAAATLWAMTPTARGQDIFVSNSSTGTIGEYTTSGATVNASLISGLNAPAGIAVSGSNLFIANFASGITPADNGTVGEYTTSGATVNASLISGLNGPTGIAVSGSDLLVGDYFNAGFGGPPDFVGQIGDYTTSGSTVNPQLLVAGSPTNFAVLGSDLYKIIGSSIGEYTTSGATVNASLVTGLNFGNDPFDITVSGSDIFVTYFASGTIGEYTTSGATVNASLITGLDDPTDLVVSGSDIFVSNYGSGTVGEYTTSGSTVNASLITGLNDPIGITVSDSSVPDAGSTSGLMFLSLAGLAFLRRRVSRAGVRT